MMIMIIIIIIINNSNKAVYDTLDCHKLRG